MVSRVLGGFEDLFETPQDYETARVKAKEIREIPHHITFTHGDLISHNILIERDGYLSWVLDWESAGWLPEYWDLNTATRFGRGTWWVQAVMSIGGKNYEREMGCEKAPQSLTIESYVGM